MMSPGSLRAAEIAGVAIPIRQLRPTRRACIFHERSIRKLTKRAKNTTRILNFFQKFFCRKMQLRATTRQRDAGRELTISFAVTYTTRGSSRGPGVHCRKKRVQLQGTAERQQSDS
jgi:hypothetical protein